MLGLRAYRKNLDGGVAVEGAILFPILILVGFGALDASLLMAQNHRMEAGLVSAGNYLARAERPQSVEDRARQLATSGSLAPGARAFVRGWTPDAVQIQYRNVVNPNAGGTRQYRGGDVVQVVSLRTEKPYTGLGFIRTVSGGQVRLRATHEERRMGRERMVAR